MGHNDAFEALLHARHIPEMRSNLEHRILQASVNVKKGRTDTGGRGRRSFLAVIFDNLLLPRPAFSLAVILILGAGIGLYSTQGNGLSESDLDAFFLASNDVEYGEFL